LCHCDWRVHPFEEQDAKKLQKKKKYENSFCPFPKLFKKLLRLHQLQNKL